MTNRLYPTWRYLQAPTQKGFNGLKSKGPYLSYYKLFYTKKKEYADRKMEDPFLQALAESGHQVGELAKHYFPGGHGITTLDYEEAHRLGAN